MIYNGLATLSESHWSLTFKHHHVSFVPFMHTQSTVKMIGYFVIFCIACEHQYSNSFKIGSHNSSNIWGKLKKTLILQNILLRLEINIIN